MREEHGGEGRQVIGNNVTWRKSRSKNLTLKTERAAAGRNSRRLRKQRNMKIYTIKGVQQFI